jgi:hypothetical protein
MNDGGWSQRLKTVIAPVLLVVLPLCLFGPYTVFSGNEAEFTAPFSVLVRPLLLAGAGIAVALIAVGIALRGTMLRAYVAFLFGLGLVVWIQGNLLVADYGPLDGTAIDFALQSWRNPYEIALWTIVPLLCIAAAKHVARIAPFASTMLVALQMAALGVSAFSAGGRATAEWKGPDASMFELSRKQNIIHIVLDAFQSDFFHEILNEDRKELDQSLAGAVFFADHTGAFPTTMVSIPAMLTGAVYRHERPLPRYVREIFDKGSLFKALRAHGYRVDNIADIVYDTKSASSVYRTRRPYIGYDEYVQFAGWQLADLSLFRHAPHLLRPYIYNDQAWRLQTRMGPGDTAGRRHLPVSGSAVLLELSQRLITAVDEPVYKFIHVGIPHRPVTLTAECEYIEGMSRAREYYKGQTRCAVRRLVALLDRLREVGAYDNSLIVITSDHGIGYAPQNFVNDRQIPAGLLSIVAGKSKALLIVKTPGSRGPVRVSNAPTTISDVSATVLDAAGLPRMLPGEPALKLAEDAQRVRGFGMYDWEDDGWKQPYFDALDVLELRGPAVDGNSWKLVDSLYPPDANEVNRTRGVHEVQRSRAGFQYRWSSPHGFFHAPPQARSFEIEIRSIAPKPQIVTLAAAGRVLDTITLSDHEWVTVKGALPPPATPATNWLELHVDPPWRPRGEARNLGVQTRDLKFGP